MMSLSTVKYSERKLSPHSDVREGDTWEGDIMQFKQQKERILRIGAWNVRALLQDGKLENSKEEMRRNKVDVVGISEVRWEQSGEFKMFYSSGDAKGNHGVGVVVGPRATDKVISVHYVDSRVR